MTLVAAYLEMSRDEGHKTSKTTTPKPHMMMEAEIEDYVATPPAVKEGAVSQRRRRVRDTNEVNFT